MMLVQSFMIQITTVLGKELERTEPSFNMVLALFIPQSQPFLLLLVVGIGRLGNGFAGIVNYALQADLMDYVEWKRDHRTEGAIASIFSFIAKAGGSLGGAIPGYVLAATGYVPKQPQGPLAISGMVFLFLWLPVIATILSLLFMLFMYPITKNVSKEMQSDLESRRNRRD